MQGYYEGLPLQKPYRTKSARENPHSTMAILGALSRLRMETSHVESAHDRICIAHPQENAARDRPPPTADGPSPWSDSASSSVGLGLTTRSVTLQLENRPTELRRQYVSHTVAGEVAGEAIPA